MTDGEMDGNDRDEYDLMMELEQFESLKEEMEELGVATLREVDARILALHEKLDEMDRGRKGS